MASRRERLHDMEGALHIMNALRRKPMLVTELCQVTGRLQNKQSLMARNWIKPLYDAGWVYIHDWRIVFGQAYPVFGWCGPGKHEEDAPTPNVKRIRISWDTPIKASGAPTTSQMRNLAKGSISSKSRTPTATAPSTAETQPAA